jgi:hypothetical protein
MANERLVMDLGPSGRGQSCPVATGLIWVTCLVWARINDLSCHLHRTGSSSILFGFEASIKAWSLAGTERAGNLTIPSSARTFPR